MAMSAAWAGFTRSQAIGAGGLHNVEDWVQRELGRLRLLDFGVDRGQNRAILLFPRRLARYTRFFVGTHCGGGGLSWNVGVFVCVRLKCVLLEASEQTIDIANMVFIF